MRSPEKRTRRNTSLWPGMGRKVWMALAFPERTARLSTHGYVMPMTSKATVSVTIRQARITSALPTTRRHRSRATTPPTIPGAISKGSLALAFLEMTGRHYTRGLPTPTMPTGVACIRSPRTARNILASLQTKRQLPKVTTQQTTCGASSAVRTDEALPRLRTSIWPQAFHPVSPPPHPDGRHPCRLYRRPTNTCGTTRRSLIPTR